MNLGTIAGQAASLLIVVNTLQHATGFCERWFTLLLAVLISIAAVFLLKPKGDDAGRTIGIRIARALVGGFVVYATAFGANASVVSEPQPTETVTVEREVSVERSVPGGMTVREMRVVREPAEVPKPQARSFTSPW